MAYFGAIGVSTCSDPPISLRLCASGPVQMMDEVLEGRCKRDER